MLRALVTEDCGIYCGASRTAVNRLFAEAVLKGNGKVEYKIIGGEVLLIGDIVAVALKLEAIFRFGQASERAQRRTCRLSCCPY